MIRICVSVLLLLFSADAVYGHSEQVLFVPIGQIMALGALFIAGVLYSMQGFRRWIVLIVAAIICVTIWFIPSKYLPGDLTYSGLDNFIIGFFPPIILGGSLTIVIRLLKKRK